MAMGMQQNSLGARLEGQFRMSGPFFEREAGLRDSPRIPLKFSPDQVRMVVADCGIAAWFAKDDFQTALEIGRAHV